MKAKLVALSEFCTFSGGGKLKLTKQDYTEQGFPAFSASGQDGNVANWEFDRPAVVLSSIGARCGKCFLAKERWTSLANTYLIFPDLTKCDPTYLWHQLNDEKSWVRSGTAQPFIKPSDVKSRKVLLHSLREQQRIVDILDRAASIQRLRQAADEKLKQIIPALFVDMFGDPATVKVRWPHMPLEQVADIGSGVTKGRKLDPNEAIDVPYLRVANVQDGYLDLSEIKTITIRENEKAKYALEDGDIVMTEGGDLDKLGRGYVWEGNLPYCAHQNHVFRVRPKRELVCPYYLAAYAASPAGKDYFLRVAKRTTGIASINKTQLSALPVPVPPITLQQEFERKLGDLRSIQRLSTKATDAALQTANAASAAFFAS